MRIVLKIFPISLILLALTSCKQESSPKLEDLAKSLNTFFDAKVKEINSESTKVKEQTMEEVAKLHALEYKVASFENTISPTTIEEELNSLGKERWNCFFAERVQNKLNFYCSRKPHTYLRYIPRMAP